MTLQGSATRQRPGGCGRLAATRSTHPRRDVFQELAHASTSHRRQNEQCLQGGCCGVCSYVQGSVPLSRFRRGRRGSRLVNGAYDGCAEQHPRVNHRLNGLLFARAAVSFSLVLAQLVYVLTVHLSNCCAERYFAWAPNDYSIVYRITATVNGRRLNAAEVLNRYRIPQSGFYEDPVERLEGVLRNREITYGVIDHVSLLVQYRLDGHPPSDWRWSNDK